ncbi:MAG TPA: isocitrate lyase/phosphoenolpyruvate mutase family protein [Gemmataceae bacterium]|nr:isocitrate lyase/phosphoenolpyruvate mutase family protein [Gemmataceae bacterium]
MERETQRCLAEAFRKLHDRSRLLVLPNAWDVVSARIFEQAGFPAVATSSAAVAWSLGYPDGEYIHREEMAEVVRRIAHALAVPVTADMEAGYGPKPEDAAATLRAVVEAGAVGLNLEDSIPGGPPALFELSLSVERVRAVREAADAAGVPVVVNARTDVYLLGIGAESERFEHAVRRVNAYRQAGADSLFVPGVRDAQTIGQLVRAIDGPLNVLAGPGIPTAAELQRLGVARISTGGGPMRATLTLVRRIAEEMRDAGVFTSFTRDTISYDEVNALLAAKPS